ncbi:MAG: His-Xaa-Ser system radical SAM maturase HxsB [Elusimicrobiota bacterium]
MGRSRAPDRTCTAAPLYSRKLGGRHLITNDWGHYAFLSQEELDRLRAGRLGPAESRFPELVDKGFIRERMDFKGLAGDFRTLNRFLWQGPTLHIFVTTLRCNHACLYCQSSAGRVVGHETDMSLETAKAAVDMVFAGPNRNIAIEFQGGEPLLNWPVVRFVVQYARKRNEAEKRSLFLSVVTNLSLMDEGKLEFLLDNEVSICTSLDGPAPLHDRNRVFHGGSSQETAVRWIKEIERRRLSEPPPRRRIFKTSALMTTTRFSLPAWREIVDTYLDAGFGGIFLRPLSPIGYAKKVWGTIGYGAEEYLDFYRRALDYILEINLRGRPFIERMAAVLAWKVLKRRDPNFVDCRSPCGASIGQVAYNFDGDIYTCDEGRMVAQQGDPIFRIGNVLRDSYDEIMASPATKGCCMASVLDSQPACSRCVYKPYCGLCPVYNYEAQGSLMGQLPRNMHCRVLKGVFDILFEKLDDRAAAEVIEGWLDSSRREVVK